MRRSLRTRLTILFLAIAIIPLLLVAIVGIWQIIASQRSQSINVQTEIARRVAISVTEYIQKAEDELKILIEVRNIGKLHPEQIQLALTGMLGFSDVYNEISLVDKDGNEIVKVSRDIFQKNIVLGNVAGKPEFEQPKESGQTFYGNVFFDEQTNEPFMNIALPIIDLGTGETTGVLISKLKFKTVWVIMTDASTTSLSVFLVDKTGNVVAHTNPSIVLQGKKFQKPEAGTVGAGLVSASAVIGVAPVVLNNNETFYALTEIPTAVALSASTRFTTTAILILLGTILAISVFSVWQTRQFTHPIEQLAETAKAIAAGNFDARVNIESEDEIGTLGANFNQMASQLFEVLTGLESRVADRTQELEKQTQELAFATQTLQTRANDLQAIADISRKIALVRDINELLPSIASTISERFGYYHVGIFLVDKTSGYAVLRATNSTGGQAMLKRGHQLKVGETGLVGTAAKTGQPSIALDTGKDSVYFNNPDLPGTRSELALPLNVGNRTIGVLDVQSTEPEAFSEENLELLGVLADQVGIAIENARLFQETQQALQQAEDAYKRFIRQEWGRTIQERGSKLGYLMTAGQLSSLEEPVVPDEMLQVITTGSPYYDEKKGRVVTPILLRGEVLGTLDIAAKQRSLQKDEIDIAQSIAERVAFAIENARLIEDSQRRAAKEQTIGEITSKIGASINMRNVLQTAVEELGRVMPGSEILIQFKDREDS